MQIFILVQFQVANREGMFFSEWRDFFSTSSGQNHRTHKRLDQMGLPHVKAYMCGWFAQEQKFQQESLTKLRAIIVENFRIQNRQFRKLQMNILPIRTLTRTKSSCSDDIWSMTYHILNFDDIWRNFYCSLHSLHFTSTIT